MTGWLEPPPPREKAVAQEPLQTPPQPPGQVPEHLQRRQRYSSLGGKTLSSAENPDIQAMRDEAQAKYAVHQPPPEIPTIGKKPRRWGFLLLFFGTVVAMITVSVIALINILYVRNAGQTIQSLTMVHLEVAILALIGMFNAAMVFIRRG